MTAATAAAATTGTKTPPKQPTGRQTSADLAFYRWAMKAPALLEAAERLTERARAQSWTHTEYLAAYLQREVAAREAHGGEARIRATRFPAIKTIEELDTTLLHGVTRQQLSHLGTLDFITTRDNVVFLGPPGTGKTHLATGEVFGDETVAAAMIDRLVHHAEVHSLKGDSYRTRGRNLGRVPAPTNDD